MVNISDDILSIRSRRGYRLAVVCWRIAFPSLGLIGITLAFRGQMDDRVTAILLAVLGAVFSISVLLAFGALATLGIPRAIWPRSHMSILTSQLQFSVMFLSDLFGRKPARERKVRE
jgi:hypothetical protein